MPLHCETRHGLSGAGVAGNPSAISPRRRRRSTSTTTAASTRRRQHEGSRVRTKTALLAFTDGDAHQMQYATAHGDSLTSHLGPIGRVTLTADWVLRRKGLGTSNFFEAGAFLRTRDDVAFPNMQYEFLPLTRQMKDGRLIPIPGFQLWMDLSRPESRGTVRLRSSNPADQPSIVFNRLEQPQDLRDLIHGVRLAGTLIHQPAWDRYRGSELSPGPDVLSDRDIEVFIRQRASTSYHASGSCRMGVDADAVVDGQARVNAVHRMRIVDASIMPRIITGNLNAPVLMMAEKISDRILERPALPTSQAPFYRTTPA
jgi:choline dehydrogenase